MLEIGETYEGEFFKGQKHGNGEYKWATGDTYIGNFCEDKREGLGVYDWSEGGFYKGEWSGDRMNGYGKLIKEGVDIAGEFFADHFVRPVEEKDIKNPQLRDYIFRQ